MSTDEVTQESNCGRYYETPPEIAPGPTPTPPPPGWMNSSIIGEIGDEVFMDKLIINFLENPCRYEFIDKARRFLELVGSGTLISEAYASTISDASHEVWHDKCCYNVVCSTIDEKDSMLIYCLFKYSNDHLPFRRMIDMNSDNYLPNMLHAITDGKTATTIRVCMSIVMAYWIDETQLFHLDDGYGKDIFRWRVAKRAAIFMARKVPNKIVEERIKKPQFNNFSYVLESATDVQNMEPLRKELVNKFGVGYPNIEAILDEAKKELVTVVGIKQNYLGYDGGKLKIQITVVNGRYGCASVKRNI